MTKMEGLQTPQDFLFEIYNKKMLDAEMALVRYVRRQKHYALRQALEQLESYKTEHAGYVIEKAVFEKYVDDYADEEGSQDD